MKNNPFIKSLFLLFFTFVFLSNLPAQTQKYYDSPNYDAAYWVAPTEMGGYTFCGRQGNSALLAEVDSSGNLLFDKAFSGSGIVEFRKNVSTPSGVFAVGTNKTIKKALCVFTDHSGNILWQKEVPNSPSVADGCTLLNNGDVLFFGQYNDRDRVFLMRLDTGGTVVWEKRYSSTVFDNKMAIRSVIETANGDFAMVGTAYSGNRSNFTFLRVSGTTGVVVASKIYDGGRYEVADDIHELTSGEFLVTGHSWSWGSASHMDGVISKLDTAGSIIWLQRATEPGRDHRFATSTIVDTNKIACISTVGSIFNGTPSTSFFVFDDNGVIERSVDIDLNVGFDFSVGITSVNNNLVMTGGRSTTMTGSDFAVNFIKLDNYQQLGCHETASGVVFSSQSFSLKNSGFQTYSGYTLNSGNLTAQNANLTEVTTCTPVPPPPSCEPPTGVSISSIRDTRVLVTWDTMPNVSYYEIMYRVVDSGNPWTRIRVNAPASQRWINSLIPGVSYEYRMRVRCTSGVLSSWGSTNIFITDDCTIPLATWVTNVTQTTAKINWAGTNASRYRISFRPAGTVTYRVVRAAGTAIFRRLINLVPNTEYEYILEARCPYGWSGQITGTFKTLGFSLNRDNSLIFNTLKTIDLDIYPNPTADVLYIKATEGGNYRLYNQNGQLVNEGNGLSDSHEIECASLADGIYFIEYRTEHSVEMEKVVIHK